MTMQAVMLLGPRQISCEELPVPEPGPEEVVLRVVPLCLYASVSLCLSGKSGRKRSRGSAALERRHDGELVARAQAAGRARALGCLAE